MKFRTTPIVLFTMIGLMLATMPKIATAQTRPVAAKQAPGFYRGYVGAFEITALSDGTAPRHLDEILSDPRIAQKELSADHESEPVPLSINAYLINTGSQLILIDTGAGELFGPTSGSLIYNLRGAGYEPGEIDAILLTHIHADHSGGLSVGGIRQFPKATVYVDNRDVEYFVTRKDDPHESETLQRQIKQSRATVGPYLKVRKIALIKGDDEVVAGITAIGQPGHTPGHTAYLVRSSGHELLVWGDIIHSSEVQFEHPEVTVQYDVDVTRAVQTRLRQFKFAADNGVLVASAHISFPGLGYIRKVGGGGYRWVPIPYSTTARQIDGKP